MCCFLSILLFQVECKSYSKNVTSVHRKGNTNGTQPYAGLPPEALLGNSLGVLIVAFGLVVLKILANSKWQRPDSRPEDMAYTVRISL